MSFNKPIHRIAIVGTGVIGASWAAQYLARGFDVVATDPAPNAEANLRKYVDEAWEQLKVIGLSPGAARDRLTFTSNMKEALSKADFVQENGPERPDFKIKLFADMDDATPPDSIIASSSSGITPSVMQSEVQAPRALPRRASVQSSAHHSVGRSRGRGQNIARRNPAGNGILCVDRQETHLPAEGTSRSCGEPAPSGSLSRGHVSDSAGRAECRGCGRCRELWAGLRWGVMGPSLQWHLGGGAGGIKHFMEHLMDPMGGMFKVLGNPDITPALKQTIIDGVMTEAANRSVDQLAKEENELLVGLLNLRAQRG